MERRLSSRQKWGLPTLRTEIAYDQATNNIQLLHNLDLLEEIRTVAQLRLENYQKAAERYYNKRVHSRTFREGDWILRKVTGNKKKLEPNWEGPFEIIEVLGRGSYTLKNVCSGKIVPRTWNSMSLKQYYC